MEQPDTDQTTSSSSSHKSGRGRGGLTAVERLGWLADWLAARYEDLERGENVWGPRPDTHTFHI